MVQTAAWSTTYRVPDTLPSDTEESIVGTQWHQQASSQLADMLRDVADRRGASWGVCEWITLIGLRHENGTDYDPKPDVMVLRQPLASGSLASVRLDRVGAPLLVVEVASESTKESDQGDKRAAYAAVGVPEYIVYDPGGTLLARPLMAWRLEGAAYVPWEPDADGWWHSRVLDVSFQPGRPYLSVRDRDGVVLASSGAMRRHARTLEQRMRKEAQARELEQRMREEAQAWAQRLQDEVRAQEQRLQDEARARALLEERLAEEAQARAALEETVRRLSAQHEGPETAS